MLYTLTVSPKYTSYISLLVRIYNELLDMFTAHRLYGDYNVYTSLKDNRVREFYRSSVFFIFTLFLIDYQRLRETNITGLSERTYTME